MRRIGGLLIKIVNWMPHKRPSIDTCPKEFCYFWLGKGDSSSPGLYADLEEALANAQEISKSICGCSFGPCQRENNDINHTDWYEPSEPKLKEFGLPWFYFVNPETLSYLKRLKYGMYFKS